MKRARDAVSASLTVCALAIALVGCTSRPSQLRDGPGSAAASSPVAAATSGSAVASGSPASLWAGLPPPGPASGGGAITATLVPLPARASTIAGQGFTVTARTTIVAGAGAAVVAADLAALLRPATGFALPVVAGDSGAAPRDSIVLRLLSAGDPGGAALGGEGYDLTVASSGVLLVANAAAGLFHGVETLRQLLPAALAAATPQAGPWRIVGGRIIDYPRFAYRGAMLDVARHFFTVAQVERYIDELALYKVNYLHLHLSDDQGWRLAIDGWPNLAQHGGDSEVGSTTTGGYYTKADYSAIVAYAAARFITVVPEIDTPGHVNAALSSYPSLNCNGVAPPVYTGENVGFSSLCVNKPVTYEFLDAVVGELAELTPGPYIDLGGDEAHSTSASDYVAYVEKAQAIVKAHGKTLMGWAEIAQAKLDGTALAEYWNFQDGGTSEKAAAAQGIRVVEAPADHAYLDQKYGPQTKLGLTWAGYTDVEDAYGWDPVDGKISASDVFGVEGPLWSETVKTSADIDFMAWPRMAGIAEIGWTPQAERSWTTYEPRLAAQAPRWAAMGVMFYRSPQVAWVS